MNVRYITHDCKIKGYIDLTKHQKLLETIITMFDLPFAINSRGLSQKHKPVFSNTKPLLVTIIICVKNT